MSLTLVYMNRSARRTVTELSGAVRSAFGMSVEQLLGGSIHRFHEDPARVDRILADPGQLPREAGFGFGGKTLRTRINSITDGSGTTVGYIVLWDDVTGRNASADSAAAARFRRPPPACRPRPGCSTRSSFRPDAPHHRPGLTRPEDEPRPGRPAQRHTWATSRPDAGPAQPSESAASASRTISGWSRSMRCSRQRSGNSAKWSPSRLVSTSTPGTASSAAMCSAVVRRAIW